MEDKFIIKNPGNVILEFIADGSRYTTTMCPPGENHIFFSQELCHAYSDKQILIFQFGSENGENYNLWHFDLRKDLKDGHLNFDNKINGSSINTMIPSNQEVKKMREFFLHVIPGIPNELIINIYHLEDWQKPGTQKLVKSYELKPSL